MYGQQRYVFLFVQRKNYTVRKYRCTSSTMPAIHGEKLYGPPGPQNNAVLMDIISKLKKELQQSKAENGKLVDQLNVLISLVKRYII